MKKAFDQISEGLNEAIEYSQGVKSKAVVHKFSAVDVKKIRANVGMTQTEFASAFGISVSTLRHWERGDRKPQGPALVLLNLVSRKPKDVMNYLSQPLGIEV